MRFVDLETARHAEGLRLVLLKGVPSPWSQAAKAIIELKGIDALGVWMNASDPAVTAWTGMPNAPVAMYPGEPPRHGWAEILTLAERLAPQPQLVPEDIEARIRMFGLSNELMGEHGLLWNARLMTVEASFHSDGKRGFPVAIAKYLGDRYGYREGCGDAARADVHDTLATLGAQLQAGLDAGGPYYFGPQLTALDIYSATVLDTLSPLPEADCPMHPRLRQAFESQRDEVQGVLPQALIAHRDMMHQRHIPLPLSL